MDTNQQGQKLGTKGRLTRARLMAAAAKLLKAKPLSDLTVLEIARKAKSSPATFYLYFRDVEDVIFALSEDASREVGEALSAFEGDWDEVETKTHALEFVAAFQGAWEQHREVLRARNAEADRGNERFFFNRLNSAIPILDAFAARIAAHHQLSREQRPLAFAIASVLYTSVERLAATAGQPLSARGVTRDHLRDAQAILIALAMSADRLPLGGGDAPRAPIASGRKRAPKADR